MLTGYLSTLPQDVLLNMGVLFYTRNGVATRVGVTEGAPDFDPGVELADLEFDGKRCRLKAQTRRVGFKPVIKGTLKEFGPQASGGQIGLIESGVFDPSTVMAAPGLAASTTGGTLAATTYYYKVSALNGTNESLGGTEASVATSGSTGSVTVTWSAVPGATSYRVYRGTTAGAESTYYAASGTSFLDTGAAGTGGSPLASLAVTTVVPKPAGSLFASTDYINNLRWIFERGTSNGSGPYACIYFPIALCTKYSVKGVDKKEAQIAFEFEAVGDPAVDLGVAPYLIELRTALPTV